MGRSTWTALAAAALLGLAACGGGSPADSASPSPTEAAPSSSSAPSSVPSSPGPSGSGSPSSTLATLPAEQCLTGSYRLVRFVAASDQTYGTGQGGDLTVAFADGRYTLAGAGSKPIKLNLPGASGTLAVDGEATGTVTLNGWTATFTAGTARGSGTLKVGDDERRLTMNEVTNVIGLQGDGQVACTADALTITLTAVRLELVRG